MVEDGWPDPLRRIYREFLPYGVRRRVAAWRQRGRHWPARTDPRFQQSMARLGALRDSQRGRSCVIIGNGPSMRDFDLSQLSNVHTFCLNRGYLLWNEQGLVPDYLVSVNRLVLEQFGAEIEAMECETFVPWLQRHLLDDRQQRLIFFEERWDNVFVGDAHHGVASLATVTNSTLQLAWHLGFAHVILLGIDHHFAASERGRPHEMVNQTSDDVDHFRPDYFAPGTRWHLPDLELSELGYRLAKERFESDGRTIVNATPDTRLEIFDRRSLDAALASVPLKSDAP